MSLTQPTWHLFHDGTVLSSWAEAETPDQVRYERYTTTRPLGLEDLAALDQRIARFTAASNRWSLVLLVTFVGGLVAAALGWLVLPYVGVGGQVSSWLFWVGAPLAALGALAGTLAPGAMRRRIDRIFHEAGFTSIEPQMLGSAQARPLLEAPGTRSAPRTIPGAS